MNYIVKRNRLVTMLILYINKSKFVQGSSVLENDKVLVRPNHKQETILVLFSGVKYKI